MRCRGRDESASSLRHVNPKSMMNSKHSSSRSRSSLRALWELDTLAYFGRCLWVGPTMAIRRLQPRFTGERGQVVPCEHGRRLEPLRGRLFASVTLGPIDSRYSETFAALFSTRSPTVPLVKRNHSLPARFYVESFCLVSNPDNMCKINSGDFILSFLDKNRI